MPVRHSNPTQQVKQIIFEPILPDEGPFFNNLNRAPKNAYDYANIINNVLSYNGCVSRVKTSVYTNTFSLYDIVHLLDGEIIEPISVGHNKHDRFGIVLTEEDADGYYIVCTFCPNLVFPSAAVSFSGPTGTPLYFNTSISSSYVKLSTTQDSGSTVTNIAGVPLGIMTGAFSIFFSGTARLFAST